MARGQRRSTRNNSQKSPEPSPISSPSPIAEVPQAEPSNQQETCPSCPTGSVDIPTRNHFSKEHWIRCDDCMIWYHWRCAGSGGDVEAVDKWYCNACITANPTLSITLKAPARKSVRKRTQRDYASLNTGLESDPRRWIKVLEEKSIKSDPFKRLEGVAVGLHWLEADDSAMTEPIVIEQPEGLGMKMPSSDFTVNDVAEIVGEDMPVEVIAPQEREKILNVISLEISGTKLAEMILPPKIVRDLDWVENYWPNTRKGKGHVYPKVQLYCLMGVADAWTDWHIDFAGSSVYYHILHGTKVFYFIRPTPDNLAAYERWSGTELQNHSWLGDMVDAVFKVELTQGNTMIIPTGWIHAVVGDKVLRDLKSTIGATFSARVLESMSALADFLVSEARLLESGSEHAKKEAKEQMPSDRVKDGPAMARELRWRLRLAAGYSSEDEDSFSKPRKANGNKRKRVPSTPPTLEGSSGTFKNFVPKRWDSMVEKSTEMETTSERGRRPEDGNEWVDRWTSDIRDDGDGEPAQVKTRRHTCIKVRRTAEGLERQRIERVVEEWSWM
ncbi:hypothetical protein H0H81_011313 [Sphagnurus paluster]|uniref:JmjC domain-containing histone demethylation protein 1 n=1 Tax=Sphagnurus paluster TaxID=117069 RepID=A0A9P7FNX2_9AGAR|nr:hypothetical protein H0H81_011313 [Sphagnurus paluster]